MCTSIVVNRNKTIVGWNLDILDMVHRVSVADTGVYIEILDETEGWLPLFGANARGDFVGMPTCWPHDERSDPKGTGINIINLDIDFLLQKRTLDETRELAEREGVHSIFGTTFMGALSDGRGNVLHIVPGQGLRYLERPSSAVLTNFSPYKMDGETLPWMGWDRYRKATSMLKGASDDFGMEECFEVLKATSQQVCPTRVSMVFDVDERTVFWCEDMSWDQVQVAHL